MTVSESSGPPGSTPVVCGPRQPVAQAHQSVFKLPMGNLSLSSPSPDNPPVIALRGISKKLGPTWANRHICLEIFKGEVHAVVGENGAGKSTLMKIIYGHMQPTAGQVYVNGRAVSFRRPRQAMQQGIGMVHQQVQIFPHLTALENIIVGAEPNTWGWIKRKQAKRRVRELCRSCGFDLPLDTAARELPYANRQQIEILRALHRDARVLILDEPTSLLAPPEVVRLLSLLHELRNQGQTIIFISHRLPEVFALSNRISVLSEGRLVATFVTSETRLEQVTCSMSARTAGGDCAPDPPDVAQDTGVCGPTTQRERPLLVLENVTTMRQGHRAALAGLSLDIGAGEIVGIAGAVGNGLRTLARTLMGFTKVTGGWLRFEDQDITTATVLNPPRCEFHWLPANPLEESLLPERPLWENLLLGRQRQTSFQTFGLLHRNQVITWARERLRLHDVVYPDIHSPLLALSGGNQQKVALSKVLGNGPRLVILEQPGRGLDLHAQARMVRQVCQLNAAGVTFLVLAYDLQELFTLCHRVGVLYRGRLMGIVKTKDARLDELSQWMLGLCRSSFPSSH
jgi:general nucleoside transport system ATP-binding protein